MLSPWKLDTGTPSSTMDFHLHPFAIPISQLHTTLCINLSIYCQVADASTKVPFSSKKRRLYFPKREELLFLPIQAKENWKLHQKS